MAEESAPAPSESSGEGTPKKADETKGASEASPYEMPEHVRKKVENYDNINSRYKNDPHFQKIFDYAFQGKYDSIKISEATNRLDALDAKNESQSNPDVELRSTIRTLQNKLEQLENTQAFKDVSGVKNENAKSYYDAFASIAENNGYIVDTPGFKRLFSLATDHGKKLARKYGLLNDAGQPDPTLDFNKNLIKEAFDLADKDLKEIGYDPEKVRQDTLLKMKKQREEQREKPIKDLFNPENLKTPKGRAAALKKAFYHNMREKHGVDMNDYKLSN